MDRRTFLKAVFAASVAPMSCVRALYEIKPKALTKEQIMNMALSRLKERKVDTFILYSTPLGPNPFYEHIWRFSKCNDIKSFVSEWQPPKRSN